MKILHLERKFPGNTETFIVNQINALPDLEHSVFTVNFLDALPSIANVYYPKNTYWWSDKFLGSKHISYFNKELVHIDPDVVHSHFITDACVFHPVTKKLKVPKICSCYGYDVSVIPVKFKHVYKYFYKPVMEDYDLFLAMTPEMKKDMLNMGFPASKIKVHYHGIDTKMFDNPRSYILKDSPLRILTTASLLEVKGHETVLYALARLKNNSKLHFQYDIVGDGELKGYLVKLCSQLGISNDVKFHGYLFYGSKVFQEIMRSADVFVHPSVLTRQNDKEGIPGAIVEAMASGLPVIATYHGGIPYVIRNRETGFLIQEKDDEALAGILTELFDSGLRKSIGTAARKYAQTELDLFKKAEDLKNLYKSLL